MQHKVKNSQLIPALNALAALVVWLKPGKLAFRIGQLKAAIEPEAIRIQREHQRLIDAHVLFDVAAPKAGDATPADDQQRKRRVRTNEMGVEVFDFGSKQKEFDDEFRKLMDDDTPLTVTRLLTLADIEAIERYRVEPKRDRGGSVAELPPVDFAALLPFMDQDDLVADGDADAPRDPLAAVDRI